jgi:hypothetical protein
MVWLNFKQMLKMGRRRIDVSGLKQPQGVLECRGSRHRMALRLNGMSISFQSRCEWAGWLLNVFSQLYSID